MASIEDQYQKALQLSQDDNSDSTAEPYKSKYAAREIFEELKSRLSKQLDEDDVDEESSFVEEGVDGVCLVRARMAAVVYHLGVLAVETEEFSTGEEHLNKALVIIGDDGGITSGISSLDVSDAEVASVALSADTQSLLSASSEASSISPTAIAPPTISLAISCHNQLGILWSNRGVYTKAKCHLDRANTFYSEYNKRCSKTPKTIQSLFSTNGDKNDDGSEDTASWAALEKLHTLTYYYLAQVYGHLGAAEKSAWYCHSTLQRQLASKEYEPLEWAINAATLAQFYLGKEKFCVARHLLASSSKVLSGVEVEIDMSQPDADDTSNKREKFEQCRADVARYWGRYCLALLQASCDRINDTEQDQDYQEEDVDKQLEFVQLEVSDLESEVSSSTVFDFEDARGLFLCGLRWMTVGRQYYTLEDHASDHVTLTQEMSQLYKSLAFFEPAEDRRCKMHKRRIDLLTVLIKELNPQYYLHVCRQINYELGETYSAMMDDKLAQVPTASQPTPSQGRKINQLATSSIQHFLHYLDSLKDNETGEQPAVYPEDSVRPALVAWFHLGRLWSKLVANDSQTKLQNLAQSLQNYKRLVEYCDQHPECQEVMAQEVAVCREMVQLLPLKMEQVRALTGC